MSTFKLGVATNTFGSRLNMTFYSAWDMSQTLGIPVGVETWPTWFSSGTWLRFMRWFTKVPILSFHSPTWADSFDHASARENAQTGPVFGTPGNSTVFRLARRLSVPINLHGVTILKLFKLGLHAVWRLEGIELTVEQGRGDPYPIAASGREDLACALQGVRMLRWAGLTNVSINYDIGHAGRENYESGDWDGRPESFMSQVFEPEQQLLAEQGLTVTQAHLHNYHPGKGYQGDHLHLLDPDGLIPAKEVIRELITRYPGIRLIFEVAPDLDEAKELAALGWIGPIRRQKVEKLLADCELVLSAAQA